MLSTTRWAPCFPRMVKTTHGLDTLWVPAEMQASSLLTELDRTAPRRVQTRNLTDTQVKALETLLIRTLKQS